MVNFERNEKSKPTINNLHRLIMKKIKYLYPGYFALVMATGIVSIAAFLQQMSTLAWILFYINQAAYIILWILTLARIFHYPTDFFNDLTNHTRGPGFFTMVAGTCVLGSQYVIIAGNSAMALFLLALGTLLWIFIMYVFFTSVIVGEPKPVLEKGINGAWLIAIVATQSVSILGSLLAEEFGPWKNVILFSTLTLYLIGCMLYILIISLIFYRFIFFKLTAAEMTPPYWINMGAVAITTLAGATLMFAAPGWDFLHDLLPFLKGFTLFFWGAGTWWIPLLFILGAWRHIYKRLPLTYDPQYWGMVFPLGMYTTCTFQLARSLHLDFLFIIPKYFVYVALIAWLLTFIGWVHAVIKEPIMLLLSLKSVQER